MGSTLNGRSSLSESLSSLFEHVLPENGVIAYGCVRMQDQDIRLLVKLDSLICARDDVRMLLGERASARDFSPTALNPLPPPPSAGVVSGVLFLAFLLVLTSVALLRPFFVGGEMLRRRTGEAFLGFLTASIGIVIGVWFLVLSTTVRCPVLSITVNTPSVPASIPPISSMITGSMVCWSPQASGTSR